jgi:hypothetical protein
MTNENYDIIRGFWELKDDPLYPFGEDAIRDYPLQHDLIRGKQQEFIEAIARLDNLTIADLKQCKRNLLRAVDMAIEIVSANKLGYPLARNQGLIIENYVYGKLLSIIEGAVHSPLGVGYPNFYYERGGDFDGQPLLQILQSFKRELQNREFPNYPSFVEFFEQFKDQIQELWRRENRQRQRGIGSE